MYLDIGKYISEHAENATYGDSFVDGLADFFAKNYPDLKGFSRRRLYRMKQFYELYKDDEKSVTAGDTIELDASPHNNVSLQEC